LAGLLEGPLDLLNLPCHYGAVDLGDIETVAGDRRDFKIVDVRVENLSMAITLRSEYTTQLQRNGGSVSGLIDDLKQRLASGAVGDPKLTETN
ncbi:MAG: ABC transporter substrate-binding protein, partial [Limibacillus sp.]